MKITSVDIWTVVVPTIPGRVHSPEWVPETGWDQVPKHILRLNTDTELHGIGETGRGVPLDQVQDGARLLLGSDPERLCLRDIYSVPCGRVLDGSERGVPAGVQQGPAYAAFEMAVLDLVGRARQRPVHALLGGAVRSRVRADYWIGHQTPEDGRRSVERALRLGFHGVKIKCKLEEPMEERLRAMRDVGGVDFKVTVDPNERFHTAEQAIELAHRLVALGNVEVFEDPIPKSDVEGYVRIHEEVDAPIAMHLGSGAAMLKALEAGCVDCFNLGSGPVRMPDLARIAEAAPACPAGTAQATTLGSWTPPMSTPRPWPPPAPWPPTSSAAGPGRTTSSSSPSSSSTATWPHRSGRAWGATWTCGPCRGTPGPTRRSVDGPSRRGATLHSRARGLEALPRRPRLRPLPGSAAALRGGV